MGILGTLVGTIGGAALGSLIPGGTVIGATIGGSMGAGVDATTAQTKAAKDTLKENLAFTLQQSDKAKTYLDPYAQAGPGAVASLQALAGTKPQKAEPPDLADLLVGAKLVPAEDADAVAKELKSHGSTSEQISWLKNSFSGEWIFGEFLSAATEVLTDADKTYQKYSKEFDSYVTAGESARLPIYQPYTPFKESDLAKLPATTPALAGIPASQLSKFFADDFAGFQKYQQGLDELKTKIPGTPEYEQQKQVLERTATPTAPEYAPAGAYEKMAAPEAAAKPQYQTLSEAAKYNAGEIKQFEDQATLERLANPEKIETAAPSLFTDKQPMLERLAAKVPTAPAASNVSLPTLQNLSRVSSGDLPKYENLALTENFDTNNPTFRAMQASAMDEVSRQYAKTGKLNSTSRDVAVAKATQANAMSILQNQQGREVSEADFNQLVKDKEFAAFLSAIGFNDTSKQLEQSIGKGTIIDEATFNSSQVQKQFENELSGIRTQGDILGVNNTASQQEFNNAVTVAAQNLGVTKEIFEQGLSVGNANFKNALDATGFRNDATLAEFKSKYDAATLNVTVQAKNLDNVFRSSSQTFRDALDQAVLNSGVTRNQFLDGLASGNQTFAQKLEVATLNNGVTTQEFNNEINRMGQSFSDAMATAGFDSKEKLSQWETSFKNTAANNTLKTEEFNQDIQKVKTGVDITQAGADLTAKQQTLDLTTKLQNAGLSQQDFQSLVASILQGNTNATQTFGNETKLADTAYNRDTTAYGLSLGEYGKQFASQTDTSKQFQTILEKIAGIGQSAATNQSSLAMSATGMVQPQLNDIAQANATSAGALPAAIGQGANQALTLAQISMLLSKQKDVFKNATGQPALW